MPRSFCSWTTSTTEVSSRSRNSGVTPSASLTSFAAISSGVRGNEPAWVTRMWSVFWDVVLWDWDMAGLPFHRSWR